MALRIMTFVLLGLLFLLIIFGWGNTSDWGMETTSIYRLLALFVIIEILFLFSVIRYQMLGKPVGNDGLF
jgi:hypothetical protein